MQACQLYLNKSADVTPFQCLLSTQPRNKLYKRCYTALGLHNYDLTFINVWCFSHIIQYNLIRNQF